MSEILDADIEQQSGFGKNLYALRNRFFVLVVVILLIWFNLRYFAGEKIFLSVDLILTHSDDEMSIRSFLNISYLSSTILVTHIFLLFSFELTKNPFLGGWGRIFTTLLLSTVVRWLFLLLISLFLAGGVIAICQFSNKLGTDISFGMLAFWEFRRVHRYFKEQVITLEALKL